MSPLHRHKWESSGWLILKYSFYMYLVITIIYYDYYLCQNFWQGVKTCIIQNVMLVYVSHYVKDIEDKKWNWKWHGRAMQFESCQNMNCIAVRIPPFGEFFIKRRGYQPLKALPSYLQLPSCWCNQRSLIVGGESDFLWIPHWPCQTCWSQREHR